MLRDDLTNFMCRFETSGRIQTCTGTPLASPLQLIRSYTYRLRRPENPYIIHDKNGLGMWHALSIRNAYRMLAGRFDSNNVWKRSQRRMNIIKIGEDIHHWRAVVNAAMKLGVRQNKFI